MGRSKNAFRNIFWGALQKIIILLTPFITRTVLIKILGAEYLGLNSLFKSVLGLLSLAELGVSDAIISAMYKPIAKKDKVAICALMNFFRKAYYIIGGIIAIIGLALCPFVPQFISGEIPDDINIYILYFVYLGDTAISYFLFAYKNCLFAAHQRNDVNSKIQAACRLGQGIIQIVLVSIFKNFYCFAIVIPATSISINLITGYLAKREFPEYVCYGKLPKNTFQDVKKRVAGLMLGKVSSTIRNSIDSLFVSAFLGLTAVAMYSNYFYIVTAVAGMIQVIESSLVAGIGNSIVLESTEKNYHDLNKMTFILQWLVGWCAICILCLEQPFMELWVGKDLMFSDTMALLCSVYLFVLCICIIRSAYTQALGIWWELRYLSIIDIIVNLLLNYFGIRFFGAYGILGATILDIVIVSIPWTTYYLFKGYFGAALYKEYMVSYLKYFICFAIGALITWGICFHLPITNTLSKLIIRLIICIIVPNLLYYLLFFKTMLFKEAKSFIKKAVLTR